ncbi:hypothetical protein D3C78_1294850 [compost metagenome]
MSNNQKATILGTHSVHAIGYNAKSIDIKTGIDFVKHDDFRVKQHHLQNFITFLLTAGEAFVQITVCKLRIHFQLFHLAFHLANELNKRNFIAFFTTCVQRTAQEVRIRNAWNFTWILHSQEQACASALVNFHFQQVFAIKCSGAFCYFIFRMAHQSGSQCTFTSTVRSHNRMDLSALNFKIDAFQNFFSFNSRLQAIDDKLCRHNMISLQGYIH